MWDLSSPTRDWTHTSLHWKRRVLTTGPPGKSLIIHLNVSWATIKCSDHLHFSGGDPTEGTSDDESVRHEKKPWEKYLSQETPPLRKHSMASFFLEYDLSDTSCTFLLLLIHLCTGSHHLNYFNQLMISLPASQLQIPPQPWFPGWSVLQWHFISLGQSPRGHGIRPSDWSHLML